MSMKAQESLERQSQNLRSVKPLTKWKNEPTVMDLKEDLQVAEPFHQEHVGRVKRWLDLRNITGTAKPKTGKNRSKVQPKLVRRQNEWRYSALSEPILNNEKMFQVKARTFEDVEKSKQNALVLNWQFNEKIDKISFVDQVVRTFVDEGTVILKLGWERVTETQEVENPIWAYYPIESEEQMEMLAQTLEAKQENPNAYLSLAPSLRAAAEYTMETQTPVFAVQEGSELVEEEVVIENRPTANIVHYENFFMDPSAEDDPEKATFAVLSFETSKAELKKDGRYKNLDKVLWSSQSPIHNPEHYQESPQNIQFKDELRKRVIAYEYWGWYDVEGDGNLKPIVATWVGDTMIRMEENPFPDRKLPFVLIPYLPVKKSSMGEPDAELLEENQAILGAITRGMIDLMGRSANGQTGHAKGMLDVVNRRRYESGQDYEFNPNIQPNVGIHQHKYPELPNSILNIMQMQNSEAEALTGVKAFSGGLSGEAYGEVAAGIRGMIDAAAKREMAILRRLGEGMKKVGKKFMMMNQQFLSEEEVVRVTNEEFIQVRREDLGGNFDMKVELSTAEIEEAQAQDLAFMLQTMGPNLPFEMTQMLLADIARLKRMPDLEKKISDFEQKPDPVAEKMKELEVAKIEQEIAKINAQTYEIQTKGMKNEADARKTSSEADLKDLDFLEQETGTKHARDIDKTEAQAEANQNLRITEAILETGENEKPNIDAAIGYKQIQDSLTQNRT